MKKDKKITEAEASTYPKNFSEYGGLTKREYFAAMIFQAIAGNTNLFHDLTDVSQVAQRAVKSAEILIDALNEKVEGHYDGV